MRMNQDLGYVEVYNGSTWYRVSGAVVGGVGTQANPATNSQQLAGLTSGVYWIQPGGQPAYQR